MVNKESAKLSVGKGWSTLIDLAYRLFERENVKVLQVKEKYGSLRLYCGQATLFTLGYISALEDVSRYVCEECGKPGTLRTDGWYKTLCDECYEENS